MTQSDYLALCGWKDDKFSREKEILRGNILSLDKAAPKLHNFQASQDVLFWEIEEKIFGSILQTQLLNTPQAIGDCFERDSKISMADGTEKNIQDVQIGEYVLNYKNEPVKVINTVVKNYTGDLITIKLKGWHRKLTATATHDALFLPNKPNKRFKYTGIAKKKFDDYKIGDILVTPTGVNAQKYSTVYSKDFEKNFIVDEKFARFIGLYLAEGGVTVNAKITFNFNIEEEDFADEICDLSEEIFGKRGVKYYHKENQNVLLVDIHSAKLARFIKEIIPGNTYSKYVPDCILTSTKLTKLNCLRGWLDGDGHIWKTSNRINGVTVSKQLLDGMASIASACGINPKTAIYDKIKHGKLKLRNELNIYAGDCEKIYNDYQPIGNIRKQKLYKLDYGYARKITHIQKNYVKNHNVYCVTVEGNHTIIVNGIATYNCVSWGEAQTVQDAILINLLALGGSKADWPGEVATEPIYGGSRCEIGGWWGQMSDGSIGLYAARWTKEYGIIVRKSYGSIDLTTYSGQRAKTYGAKGCPDELEPIAKQHPITDYALCTTYEHVRDALCGLKPVANASDAGFAMKRGTNGFCRRTGTWMHEMMYRGHCIVKGNQPAVVQKNSWGDYLSSDNNRVTLESGREIILPKGHFLVYPEDVTYQARQGDTTAKAGVRGWEPQTFSWDD